MAMDLDRRVNYLGQVPVTDATAASHTIKENSDFVKGLTSGGTLLGLGTVLAIGSVVGLVVISSR